MKKFFVVMLVLLIMAMTMVSMVSCANEPKNSNEIDLPHEVVVIDDVRIGTKYNYGSYYMFIAYNEQSYLIFMDAMDGKIELIDVSVSAPSSYSERFFVTYKLLETDN